jgi:DNA-binding transcriptional ArsR family regulator
VKDLKNKLTSIKIRKIILLLLILELTILIPQTLAIRIVNISGFSTKDSISAGENVRYLFSNNITFEIATDVNIELDLQFENKIENRKIYFVINNTVPLAMNITSKFNMQGFGHQGTPPGSKKGNTQYQYKYNCIFRIVVNSTLQNLTISSTKGFQYGFNPNYEYTLALFDISNSSWNAIDTFEMGEETDSTVYLISSISNLQADTEYYITFFELVRITDNWLWAIFLISAAVSIASIAILISKKEYFQYLRARTVPIQKGAHRLTIDEVLENENRNNIIDLILKDPGIHFNELLRRTELAAGNLVWHLDILETYKIIGKKRIGNFIAYFPYYQKNPISNVDLQLSKSRLTLEILEMIEKEPGVWNNLITGRLKVDHKTIKYHLQKLIELGLINVKKDGQRKKIFPNLDSEYFQKSKEQNA